MKKISVLTFLLIIWGTNLKAQVFISSNIMYCSPCGENQVDEYGGGFNLLFGYSLNNKLDVSAKIERCYFASFVDHSRISTIGIDIKYFPLNKSFQPYLGFGVGFVERYLDIEIMGDIFKDYENIISVEPEIGIRFDSKWIEGLYINTGLSYNMIDSNNKMNLINLKIGLQYYFKKLDKK